MKCCEADIAHAGGIEVADDAQPIHQAFTERGVDLRSPAETLDAILEMMPIGFAMLDKEQRLSCLNQAMSEISAVAREDSVGRTVTELLPDIFRNVQDCISTVFAAFR